MVDARRSSSPGRELSVLGRLGVPVALLEAAGPVRRDEAKRPSALRSRRRTHEIGAASILAFDSSVEVFKTDDVVQVRRRGLEDRRVLDAGHAMNRSGQDAEAGAGGDDLLVRSLVARAAHLDLGA